MRVLLELLLLFLRRWPAVYRHLRWIAEEFVCPWLERSATRKRKENDTPTVPERKFDGTPGKRAQNLSNFYCSG